METDETLTNIRTETTLENQDLSFLQPAGSLSDTGPASHTLVPNGSLADSPSYLVALKHYVYLRILGAILGEYGWYLLFICVGVFLLIQEFRKRRPNQSPSRSSPENLNDATSVVRRQEALEASRRKMQDELDAKAEQYKERKQKAEEEKRKQKIEMWDSMKEGRSYKSGAETADNNEGTSSSMEVKAKRDLKPLRSGYNPMTGEGGGSCSWRSGRRGPTSGG